MFAYPAFPAAEFGLFGRGDRRHTRAWPRSRRCSSRRRWPRGPNCSPPGCDRARYSIGYNISVAIFGGTAPYVATWLTDRTGNELAPAYYVIVAAVISLATVLTMRETSGRPLRKLITD